LPSEFRRRHWQRWQLPRLFRLFYAMGSDAAEVGVVNSLNRPETNVTDMSTTVGRASNRLELLLELRPGASSLVGYLDNSRLSGAFETNVENVTTAARIKGRELAVFDAGTEEEVQTAFTKMALQRVRALVVSPDAFLITRQEQIIALAAQSGLPTIYPTRGAAEFGGLMSYGVVTNDMYRVAGIFAGRPLKGATPAALPITLPARVGYQQNDRQGASHRDSSAAAGPHRQDNRLARGESEWGHGTKALRASTRQAGASGEQRSAGAPADRWPGKLLFPK
jgi:hypothetical protein